MGLVFWKNTNKSLKEEWILKDSKKVHFIINRLFEGEGGEIDIKGKLKEKPKRKPKKKPKGKPKTKQRGQPKEKPKRPQEWGWQT